MKFLIDAQLPRRATRWFVAAGYDAVHTLDLPDGNRTPDGAVVTTADTEDRVVVTKDADFVDSHLLRRKPARLLLVATGNISNAELETLLVPLLPAIARAFAVHSFLELGRGGLVVRG